MYHTPVFEIQAGHFPMVLGYETRVMGIVNVTPDSFSDGGLFFDRKKAVEQGEALADAGADIVDVGGESSRPFSDSVTAEEETKRVIPVVEELAKRLSIPISVDTTKAAVAKRAIEAGASLVNDIGAMRRDPHMAEVVADAGVAVVLMHMKGTPKDMQKEPAYENVVTEVKGFLERAVSEACEAGISRNKIIVDPGIGFGKTVTHNLLLIQQLSCLHSLDVPVLIGPSRKSFITHILGSGDDLREIGTQAAVAAAALEGVHIVRVHDVATTKKTLHLVDAFRLAGRQ
jgi:dihydropteroate synthase